MWYITLYMYIGFNRKHNIWLVIVRNILNLKACISHKFVDPVCFYQKQKHILIVIKRKFWKFTYVSSATIVVLIQYV